MSLKKKSLDLYLEEVFKQFIAIKDDDYKKAQEVFDSVFGQVKKHMHSKCNYYAKYSTQVIPAGSVYDGLKVSKLDEFDMDVVIKLPINYDQTDNGILLENDKPGFVKMQIKNAFDNLDKQPEWELRHKVTREWRDAEKYFLQNKFRFWLQSVMQKAVNEMNGCVKVNDTTYLLTYKESGPAFTLNIRNSKGMEPFLLDVDLVPVIRFQHTRWPEGYRVLKDCPPRDWLVVPKPNKGLKDDVQKNRCWRLSFQDYEKDLMKGCQLLKKTIRLIKKLRDALDMKAIASYYIKTLFLWKIDKNEKSYWSTKLSTLFETMVIELHDAIEKKNIPYFWHEGNNLIEGLKPSLQKVYLDRLKDVINSIKANDVDSVVSKMLSVEELQLFKDSEFYKSQPPSATIVGPARVSPTTPSISLTSSASSTNVFDADFNLKALDDKIETVIKKVNTIQNKIVIMERREQIPVIQNGIVLDQSTRDVIDGSENELLKILINKMDKLTDAVVQQGERIQLLELKEQKRELMSKDIGQVTKVKLSGGPKLLIMEEETRMSADKANSDPLRFYDSGVSGDGSKDLINF